MATLVLSAAGTALAGPVGGAIGALIGQQADNLLFAPKPRQGPRLGELAVQTSSYGSAIPKIFGIMRVAGTVIWSTDIRESRSSSGGKGQSKTISYSYSASFAVALSGRPIRDVRRIWADGKLLRGAAGDFKSETGFRLYRGSEEQLPDSLIEAAEGVGAAPAYRGIAYAVFEDLQLADFGNRIPSLSFEVVADDEPVAVAGIAEQLSNNQIRAGKSGVVSGYAAGGESLRGSIQSLAELHGLTLVDEDGRLLLTTDCGEPAEISRSMSGAHGQGAGGRTMLSRDREATVPDEVSIAYHDPARDYQTGLQRAVQRQGGQWIERHALSLVLSAGAAKTLAEQRLAALRSARAGAVTNLSYRYLQIRPGTEVRLEGETGRWRVRQWQLGEGMIVRLHLSRMAASVSLPSGGDPGRPIGSRDQPHGATLLRLIDWAGVEEVVVDRPQLLVAAAGNEAGWRRALLSISYDGGESWSEAGTTAAPAVTGTAATILGPGCSALIDAQGVLEVQLAHEEMWLESRSDQALVAGANLAFLGKELIQFGRAEPVGSGRFRLSRLLRGRRGTEWAMNDHGAGEPFLLVEAAASLHLDVPGSALGGRMQLMAQGLGDAEPVEAEIEVTGEALRPPMPTHLRAKRQADGDILISWVRRSRLGWTWLDGRDVPLGEEREAYRLSIASGVSQRNVETQAHTFLYSAADQAADGASGAISLEVAQLGTHGASRPAFLIFNQEQ